MDIPLIRRFEMGYKAGAEKINPKIKINSNFIGVTGEAWNNPTKAKELALSQYGSGTDVIFVAAGASGTVTLPEGAIITLIRAHSTAGGTCTIFGGDSIPIVATFDLHLPKMVLTKRFLKWGMWF